MTYLEFIRLIFLPPRDGASVQSAGRIAVLILLIPPFLLLQAWHFLGFVIDELLFGGYRRTRIERPVFIVGVPRSGTTFLHRELSYDAQFTTLRTWECLFALSVSQRKLFHALGRLDQRFGAPVAKTLNALVDSMSSAAAEKHPIALDKAEEDFLCLLPVMACFMLIVVFPDSRRIWRLTQADRKYPPRVRKAIMRFYRLCLQKHVYFHGESSVLLSKNASFAPWLQDLREVFPDARFIACMREPAKAVPSQLSAIEDAVRLFGSDPCHPMLYRRFVETFRHYYAVLFRNLAVFEPSRALYVNQRSLQRDPESAVERVYTTLQIATDNLETLKTRVRPKKEFRSLHRLGASAAIRDQEAFKQTFENVLEAYDFAANAEPDADSVQALAEREPRPLVAVFSDACPERNGVGAYYHDLAHYLAQKGIRTCSFVPDPTAKNSFKWLNFSLPGDSTQRLYIPRLRDIAHRFDDKNPMTVVVATPGPFGFLGLWLAQRYGLRLVVAFHTSFELVTDMYWNRFFGAMVQGYFHLSHKLLFRGAAQVLAPSSAMCELAENLGASQPQLIGTPLATCFLESDCRSAPTQLKRVLFAGRLAEEKNLAAILEAAKALPTITFRFAGDGPLRATVAGLASRETNVEYLGWLQRDGLRDAMDEADLLILPSHVESFGTVALEAMARQRLVLVSRHCGITQWPQLAKGLFVIPDGKSIEESLRWIASLDADWLAAKARLARSVAVRFNEWNTEVWLNNLQEPALAADKGGAGCAA